MCKEILDKYFVFEKAGIILEMPTAKKITVGSSDVVVVSKDLKTAYFGDEKGVIHVMNLDEKKVRHTFENLKEKKKLSSDFEGRISSLAISEDNKYLAIGYISGSIRLLDMQTQQEIYLLDSYHSGFVEDISFMHDNSFMVSCGGSEIKVFDLTLKRVIYVYKQADNKLVFGARISKNGDSIICTSFEGSIKILKMPYSGSHKIYVSSKYEPFSFLNEQKEDIFERIDASRNPRQMIKDNSDLCVLPHYWTLLHLSALFAPEYVAEIPKYPDFRVPHLVDKYGRTPLHYLLAQEKCDYKLINIMLEYILDYIEDQSLTSEYETQTIIESLTNLSLFIISKISPALAQRYLNLCFRPTSQRYTKALPLFGQPEKRYTFTHTPTVSEETQIMIWREGDEQITFYTNLLKLDYNPVSQDMMDMVHVLTEVQDIDLFRLPILSNLIDFLWNEAKTIMNIFALLFSLFMILLSSYIVIGQRSLWMEISIFTLSLFFIFREFIEAKVLGMDYLSRIWNLIDLAQLLTVLSFVILNMTQSESSTKEAWISFLAITFGYLRWLSNLRLFTLTRHLIAIILSVLDDIIGFITIVIAILIGFSLIFLEFARDKGEPQPYIIHFYDTYKLLYGNYDDSSNTFSEDLVISLLLVILNVILLNLLISIIGDTYGQVQERKVLIDSLTRLDMIQDAIIFRSFFEKSNDKKGYLIFCIPDEMKEENTKENEEKQLKLMNKNIEQVKRSLEEKMDHSNKNLQEKIENFEKKINQNNEKIEEKINQTNEKIEKILQLLSSNQNEVANKTINDYK